LPFGRCRIRGGDAPGFRAQQLAGDISWSGCSGVPFDQANESMMLMVDPFRPLWSAVIGACAVAIAVLPQSGGDSASDTGPGYNGAPTVISGRGVPTMNGVPCVAGHLGTCIGFAQNQPPRRTPRATVGHSPTVRP
jgi:hypothetical protein